MYYDSLLSVCSYLDAIERALTNGDCVLIENMGESIDAVLDPLVGRNTIKKGRQGAEQRVLYIHTHCCVSLCVSMPPPTHCIVVGLHRILYNFFYLTSQ